MYRPVQSLLFKLDPETAHRVGLRGLQMTRWLWQRGMHTPHNPRQVMGITFPNPIGLAAGMDKDGRYLEALGSLGFGFVEVGTVTPHPQPGNAKPRLVRIPAHQALINRMGFNNEGVDALVERLRHRRYQGRVGVNIGKNADTPLALAAEDYRICLGKVYAHADYVAINISSPNTAGLRTLQQREPLQRLLDSLKSDQATLANQLGRYVPLAVKVSPDLSPPALHELAEILLQCGMDGVIATNTTLERGDLGSLPMAGMAGGMSGAPLRARSVEVVRSLHALLGQRIPIIGVGGLMSKADGRAMFEAGAQLLQVYTGLVYRGPSLIQELSASA